MVGLLAGIGFTPDPSEFQRLLDSGDLPTGLQYVTIEITEQDARNERYMSSLFQGAAVQQGWPLLAQASLTIRRAQVYGRYVMIVYPDGVEVARKESAQKTKKAAQQTQPKNWWQFWK